MSSKLYPLFLILATLSWTLSCATTTSNTNSGAGPTSNVNAAAANTNEEELRVLIPVPFEADDVLWRQDPKTKKITAVLRLTPEDASRLTADAERVSAGEAVEFDIDTWFPEELTAQAEMSGSNRLQGRMYAAQMFYQAPYESGRLIRVEGTDYFVLELNASN